MIFNTPFRFATDECFNNRILDGIRKALPNLDIVRVQDVGLMSATDPTILDWLAIENRILLTHDIKTFRDFAFDRVQKGLFMPGIIEVKDKIPIRRVIDDIVLIVNCSNTEEFVNRVEFLPL